MFETGTRVIALNSSFSGKTGPRKGSVGYVLDTGLGEQGSYYDGDRCWFATLHRTTFVRYGFENRQRNETKFFINIFPYISDIEGAKGNITELIDEKLDLIENLNLQDEKFYDKIKYNITSAFGKKHIYTGVLVPIPPDTSLLETEPNNFAAWVECFMKDLHFHRFVTEMVTRFSQVGNVITGPNLMMIKGMIDSKAERTARLIMAQNSLAIRKDIVATIRKIVTIGGRPRRLLTRRSEREWLNNNYINTSAKKELTAIRIVLKHLYSKDAAENLEIIYKRNKGDEVIERKVKYMTEITNRMVSRARALENV